MSQNVRSSKNVSEKPFVIELWEEDSQPGGYFTPAAALHLTSSLRTSGLLRDLSPEDLKSLIYLLTFVSPEGHCQPFLSQIAEAMHISPAKAQARLRRLCDVRWKAEPFVLYSKSASGLSAYSLNPRVVTYRHRHEPDQQSQAVAPYVAAPREAVIAHSRKHYARPRAEVERLIARQMGHDVDESDEERKIRYRLENVGLTSEQAKELLATYHLDTIAQQLDWLPYRNAKNPAGYLIAAIEGDYSEPRTVREERIFREMRYGERQTQKESIEASGIDDSGIEENEPNEQPTAEHQDAGYQHAEQHIAEDPETDSSTQDESASDADVATLQADGDLINLTPEK